MLMAMPTDTEQIRQPEVESVAIAQSLFLSFGAAVDSSSRIGDCKTTRTLTRTAMGTVFPQAESSSMR